MLSTEDKQWIEKLLNTTLDHRFQTERELMREFIIEGRRQDRAWVKEELLAMRLWTENLVDSKVTEAIEKFAITVAAGFTEVHKRIDRLEAHGNWN